MNTELFTVSSALGQGGMRLLTPAAVFLPPPLVPGLSYCNNIIVEQISAPDPDTRGAAGAAGSGGSFHRIETPEEL